MGTSNLLIKVEILFFNNLGIKAIKTSQGVVVVATSKVLSTFILSVEL